MPNHPATEKLIRDYEAAIASRDLERVWSFYHDDIVYEDFAIGKINRGLEETKKFYVETMIPLDVSWKVDIIHATDEGFGITWVMTGKHVADLPGMPATGKSFKVPGASIAELKDGKIIHNRDIWNNYALLKQLGIK